MTPGTKPGIFCFGSYPQPMGFEDSLLKLGRPATIITQVSPKPFFPAPLPDMIWSSGYPMTNLEVVTKALQLYLTHKLFKVG